MHQLASPTLFDDCSGPLINSSSECHLSIFKYRLTSYCDCDLVVADLWLSYGNPNFHGNLGLPLVVDVVSLLLQRLCGFLHFGSFSADIQLVKNFCRFCGL